ncbi:MAG: YfcE family phosphodiesterase [Minisyncoccia bacterium]
MEIAIISDTHDNLENIKKTLEIIKEEEIKIILHCGDVVHLETLNKILTEFNGRVYLAIGNVDKDFSLFETIEKNKKTIQKKLKASEIYQRIKINNKKIAISHFPDIAFKLAKENKYDFIFYGHLHKPLERKIGNTKIINPGNVAGLYYRASFATLDLENDNLDLKIL